MDNERQYGVLDKKAAVVLTAVAGVVNALVAFGLIGAEDGLRATEIAGTVLVLVPTLGAGKLIEKYVYSRRTVEAGELLVDYVVEEYVKPSCCAGNCHARGPMGTVSHDTKKRDCYCQRNIGTCDLGDGCPRV